MRQHRKTRQREAAQPRGDNSSVSFAERQPFGRHRAGLGGGNQRAARLDAVAAIMKTALADIGGAVRKLMNQVGRVQVAQAEFLQTGRVDQMAVGVR